MDVIRVLLADDHPVFRFGLRALLAAEPGMEVVGEATTGEEAIALADGLMPDVVLMDLNMPGMHGIEATRRITSRHPRTSVLVITMIDDDSVFAAMRAGARGYILKGEQGEETLRAIRAVAHGEAIFSPSPASRLLDHFAAPSAPTHPFPELSAREVEILTLMAKGYTNNAIANRLFLSPKTVRNYVSSIFGKLEVNDRPAAIIRARAAGLAAEEK
jgi:DNA-binding NarL/FixJ family response regulator